LGLGLWSGKRRPRDARANGARLHHYLDRLRVRVRARLRARVRVRVSVRLRVRLNEGEG
jgi:hypothetical protein